MLDTMSFQNGVLYDNFAHLHHTEFGRLRDEKEKLSRTRDLPAPPIKRVTHALHQFQARFFAS